MKFDTISLLSYANLLDLSIMFLILPNFTSNLPFKIIQELADEIVKFVINI